MFAAAACHLNAVTGLLKLYPEWQKQENTKVAHRMDASEPLIGEYQLDNWKNKAYKGKDAELICTVNPIPEKYRTCFVRLNS